MDEKKLPEWFLIPYAYIKIYAHKDSKDDEERLQFKQVLWEINETIDALKTADYLIQNKILTMA